MAIVSLGDPQVRFSDSLSFSKPLKVNSVMDVQHKLLEKSQEHKKAALITAGSVE